jgi:hypothetical protein
MLDSIPNELRLINQWVCSGPDKEPINPRTGQRASPTDPSTWASFAEARQAGYRHIGFVLTKDDPYTIIDLDEPKDASQEERHRRVLKLFNSYSEISQSGLGIHIVVRGYVPSGVRRDKIEVYSDSRYMIFTGNVINPSPITDYNELVNRLHGEMASTSVATLEEREPTQTDEQVLAMATGATNAEKFNALYRGDLNGHPSQSEADFALLTMFCFYSKSDSQVRRLFRHSGLGQRDKATKNDDYLNRALCKIRGKQAPPRVDLSGLLDAPMLPGLEVTEVPVVAPLPVVAPIVDILLPPGLVGEIAEYVFASAIRPVREVSLAAAIALSAGVLGRSFNVSSTGLNQYIILLAKTGTGKEGAAGGIDAMFSSIRDQLPAADEFLGPGTFSSGQALTRVLDKNPCFVSVLGEVGLTLQQICDRRAGAHHIQLRKVLLDVFTKSGWNSWLRPSVYSDSEKNTALVRAPNVTILGESTPENFYGVLDGSHVSEGLIPRFLVIEYEGLRPPSNPHAFHRPSAQLQQKFLIACQIALTMRNNQTCSPVQLDQWACSLLDLYNTHADAMINSFGEDEVLKQLWNRAHIKVLKLAALVAVGCNIHQPIVTKECAQWAIELVTRDVATMVAAFVKGKVGEQGSNKQEDDVRRLVERYPQFTEDQRLQYKVPKSLLDKGNLIPYAYLRRGLRQLSSFTNDKRGAITALKIVLDDMVKSGALVQIPPDQARTQLETDSPVYYRGKSW